LGRRVSRTSGTRTAAFLEKIIASNTPEVAESLILIAEHGIHHALSSETGNRPEKAGLAKMNLIPLTVMG
tara:strand:- start:994 stop:1203 length:210 start_codon:yes stop_codon:yes gene_type:complete